MSDKDTEALVRAVLAWWRGLFPSAPDDAGDQRGKPAERARLRRCQGVMDALLEPETHRLLRRARAAGSSSANDGRLALLAIILPSVPPGRSGPPFARALGATGDGEHPVMSENRFGALLRALADDDPDRTVRALRRAQRLLGDRPFNVGAFVRDILFLNDETRRRWTYQYWQTDWHPTAPAGDAGETDFEQETD